MKRSVVGDASLMLMLMLMLMMTVMMSLCLHTADAQRQGQPALVHVIIPGGRRRPRTVCYTLDKARGRPEPATFFPRDIDPSLCTHLILAFAWLHRSGLFLLPPPRNNTTLSQRFQHVNNAYIYRGITSLKRRRPGLKVMLAVGGWDIGSEPFMKLVRSQFTMQLFAWGSINYLHYHRLDGLDVDWEYPAHRGSTPPDRRRFTRLLQTLRREFELDQARTGRRRLLLSAAITAMPSVASKAYQLPRIARHVDFLNVMTYDLHWPSEEIVGHHSALYPQEDDETDSVDYLVQWVLTSGVPRYKVNLGLPFYGHCQQLNDSDNTAPGAPASGPAPGGHVCQLLTGRVPGSPRPEVHRLPESSAPYMVDMNNTRWTAYDDETSIREKVNQLNKIIQTECKSIPGSTPLSVSYAMKERLGGVFVWTVDMDDFRGKCGGRTFPLLRAIRRQFYTAS
ncbi:chitinase-3-like protein 1 [Littorina saxatilis]|uniref:chitinase-3-like protein 1 n=1 Tax=Littorina saxatilis TaxID=31220 RepID=UPI0038B67FC1